MRVSFGQKLSIVIMVVAINLVFIYAAGMFGIPGYALLLLSSVATYTLTCEGFNGCAFFAYLLTAGIGYLIAPDKIAAIAYGAFFGHYPMFKTAMDKHFKNKLTAGCLKLLYCNGWLIVGLLFVLFALQKSIPTHLPIPMWLVILSVEIAFCIMDAVHTLVKWLYTEKLRSGIVPKL